MGRLAYSQEFKYQLVYERFVRFRAGGQADREVDCMQGNACGPRVVIVGAGSGIGLGCALAASGCDLVLADIEPSRFYALKRAAATFRYCDVMSEASVLVFANDLIALGNFDILINAAGDGYARTLGMVRMSRALIPAMRGRGQRRLVVNVAPCGGDGAIGPFEHAGKPDAFLRLSQSFADRSGKGSVSVLTVIPEQFRSVALAQRDVLVANVADPVAAGRSIMAEALARVCGRAVPTANPVALRRVATG